jgi:hypothetical protein
MLKKQWLKEREEFVIRDFSQRESGNYQNVPIRSNETVFQGNVGLSSSAAWPSLKSGSNNNNKNKAVFHGNPNFKKERNGTGVFLPRVAANTESSRKKSGKNSKY